MVARCTVKPLRETAAACSQGLYFTPENCVDPHAELAESFRMLAAACLEDAAPRRLTVAMGRHLDVPHASAPATAVCLPESLVPTACLYLHVVQTVILERSLVLSYDDSNLCSYGS